VPHALEVEGNIIRLFDPVNHEPLESPATTPSLGLSREAGHDRRWVRCKRPLVMVGGELTLESLELSYSKTTGFYTAPIQAVSNGGVLVIDDFGRQRVSARELLNRWIVPLESRVDFLTLNNGQKFELPFLLLVVFATNIRPSELVDEAFLRRIHYKVFCESPTIADFKEIFAKCCAERRIEYDETLIDELLQTYFENGTQDPTTLDLEVVRTVLDTNVLGVIRVTNAMLPLLSRANAPRIVNVSSSMGSLTLQTGPVMAAYAPSKSMLNSVTAQYARRLADTNVIVNACCPGYVATDFTGFNAPRTPEQGAAIAVRLATLPDDGPRGGFFDDEGVVPW
jgi:hypothetical protein